MLDTSTTDEEHRTRFAALAAVDGPADSASGMTQAAQYAAEARRARPGVAELPAPRDLAHRDVFAEACEECGAPAEHLCVEPYCPATLGAEFVTFVDGYHERLTCVCGSRGEGGFFTVDADGMDEVGPDWVAAGELLCCNRCFRVFSRLLVLADGEHAQVLFTAEPPF